MSVPGPPLKSAVTVTEMAEMCEISRSRFYDLMEAGVFPKPVQHPSTKRPMYDLEGQRKCLEIRQTGIGANGLPVLFNRKPKKAAQPRPQRKPEPGNTPDHAELIDALKGLGLTATPQAVAEAVATLFPAGVNALDQGDVIRRVFLHLQGGKK
jgi:hypothetical protein